MSERIITWIVSTPETEVSILNKDDIIALYGDGSNNGDENIMPFIINNPGNVTSSSITVMFSGATANDNVNIYLNGTLHGSATADSTGAGSYELTGLTTSAYTLQARREESSPIINFSANVSTTPTAPNVTGTVPSTSDQDTADLTYSNAEVGDVISAYVDGILNGSAITATATTGTITLTGLTDGSRAITFTVTRGSETQGTTSAGTITVSIPVMNTPNVSLTIPSTSNAGSLDGTYDNAEVGDIITLFVDTIQNGTAITTTATTGSFTLTGLTDGSRSVTATVQRTGETTQNIAAQTVVVTLPELSFNDTWLYYGDSNVNRHNTKRDFMLTHAFEGKLHAKSDYERANISETIDDIRLRIVADAPTIIAAHIQVGAAGNDSSAGRTADQMEADILALIAAADTIPSLKTIGIDRISNRVVSAGQLIENTDYNGRLEALNGTRTANGKLIIVATIATTNDAPEDRTNEGIHKTPYGGYNEAVATKPAFVGILPSGRVFDTFTPNNLFPNPSLIGTGGTFFGNVTGDVPDNCRVGVANAGMSAAVSDFVDGGITKKRIHITGDNTAGTRQNVYFRLNDVPVAAAQDDIVEALIHYSITNPARSIDSMVLFAGPWNGSGFDFKVFDDATQSTDFSGSGFSANNDWPPAFDGVLRTVPVTNGASSTQATMDVDLRLMFDANQTGIDLTLDVWDAAVIKNAAWH